MTEEFKQMVRDTLNIFAERYKVAESKDRRKDITDYVQMTLERFKDSDRLEYLRYFRIRRMK